MSSPAYADALFQAAGTKSKAVNLSTNNLVGFITPGTFASAAVTFEMAPAEDGTFVPVKLSSGSAVSFAVTTSGYYGFSADQIAAFRGAAFVKVVGGSSEAAGTLVKLAVRDVA